MTTASGRVPVPAALLEGFAEVWTRLAGGSWEARDHTAGRLVVWTAAGGRREALPDRMYGLAGDGPAEIDPTSFDPDLTVRLPPGATAAGAVVHAIGHQLVASTREEAWGSLRRVGRQGVKKALRTGGRAAPLSDTGWLELALAKARDLGGRAPHPDLPAALRDVFGADRTGVAGVLVDDRPAASVLWVLADDYGMLVDGASDRALRDRSPSSLAVWEAVAGLVDRGARRVDYGFSAPGAGDLLFKDHLGGRAVPLYEVPTVAPGGGRR